MNKIILGDSLLRLREMRDESVHSCVTSPPYWGLRDYGIEGQMGLEKTPDEFITKMVELFREVKRVIRSDGTLWLNIGDSYAAARYGDGGGWQKDPSKYDKSPSGGRSIFKDPGYKHGLKNKDLVGIPWMLAFALRTDGWYLRSDIIWSKPNPMPESVTDRPTKAHEYVFLLSKSPNYYYDAFSIRTDLSAKTLTTFGTRPKGNGDGSGLIASENWGNTIKVRKPRDWSKNQGGLTSWSGDRTVPKEKRDKQRGHGRKHAGFNDRWDEMEKSEQQITGANKRSVWTVATHPFKAAHFATFPEKLIEPMILAGCPRGGVVLDPFMGAGTTGLVAKKLGRKYLGIELNPAYIAIAEKRINAIPSPMF